MSDLLPVVLAGGSGSRLWPLSRELYPKQFLRLYGERTMLQGTLTRLSGLPTAPAYIVCNDEHRFLVAEQLRGIGHAWGAIILEPAARNTAPAIALAALHAVSAGADPILLVLPADHFLQDAAAFQSAVREGATQASEGALVTFGVVPTRPETGYGYIRVGERIAHGIGAARVAAFMEKPDVATAGRLLQSGQYLWNSGMFLFRASAYLSELQRTRPDIFSACERAMSESRRDLDFVRPGAAFLESPTDSIDYAVMEKTERSVVIPLDVGWNDLGSWDSLWSITPHDSDGNVAEGDVIHVDTRNTYLRSEDRLVAAVGVEDIVVVETADAVLVSRRDRVQDVRKIVDRIRSCTRHEHRTHVRVYRPWGSYESVENGDRYQVKRITVNPGSSLSFQMHHHRSEHWIVVRGTARVQRGDETFLLAENESTYIPLGAKHRLSNPGKVPLELIEVQVGTYLGEDDIVRFDDVYGRAEPLN